MTPEEAKVGELARQETVRQLSGRRVLRMDELAELKDVRPRLEKEIRLPGDSRGRSKVFMFSIDGTLRGERVTGCLFAGECILVQAESFEKANNLAKAGLHDTVEIAAEYFEEMHRLVIAPQQEVTVEVGGGRAMSNPKQPDLASDPKLKAMIEHIIGRKPWLR